MPISENIKKYRKAAGLTQKELGERLNVSASMIGQYETGKRNPKVDSIVKIAAALNTHPEDLLGMVTTDEYGKRFFDAEKFKKNSIDTMSYLYGIDESTAMKISSDLSEALLDFDLFQELFLSPESIVKHYGISLDKAADVYESVCGIEAFYDAAFDTDPCDINFWGLINAFGCLNELGQRVAVSRIQELAKIPEYQKKVDSCPEQPKMPEQSENEKTDSGKPE